MQKMESWNAAIGLIQWVVRTGGGALALVGLVVFFMSFGDNGTGDQRRLGILLFIGAVAMIAAAQMAPIFFSAPPNM